MWKKFVREYKILVVVEILLLLVFLILGMSKEKEVLKTDWTSSIEQQNGRSNSVKLTPGVYRLSATAKPMGKEEYIYFDIETEESTYKALRCDGGMISGTQGNVDFEIYVLDYIAEAYVACDMFCASEDIIDTVAIYRTGMGERIVCLLVLIVSLLANCLMIFRNEMLQGNVPSERVWVYIILLLGVFISYFPYMTDYFSLVGDVPYQCLRIEHIDKAISGGNVLLLIPGFLRWIGFPLMDCYKMYVFMLMVLVVMTTYYSAKVCTRDKRTAAVIADMYLLSPYALKCIYVRGMADEYALLILYPLVICALYAVLVRKKKILRFAWSDRVVVILMIIIIFSAMYIVNNIVYESSPTWLYNATNLESTFGTDY